MQELAHFAVVLQTLFLTMVPQMDILTLARPPFITRSRKSSFCRRHIVLTPSELLWRLNDAAMTLESSGQIGQLAGPSTVLTLETAQLTDVNLEDSVPSVLLDSSYNLETCTSPRCQSREK